MRRGDRRIFANVHIPANLAIYSTAYPNLTQTFRDNLADISAVFIIGVHRPLARHGPNAKLQSHCTAYHTDPGLTSIYGVLVGGKDADDEKGGEGACPPPPWPMPKIC